MRVFMKYFPRKNYWAMKYFPRKLMSHEIFWSMVSWATNFFFEKFVKPSTLHPSYILNVHSFTKYINLKDVTSKKEAQIKYKQY